MSKILSEHLARRACVYICQSTADQLIHNTESQRRQYGLVDRARALGWSAIDVIDDDLGRSGGGASRPGFERLLAAICEGLVGAIIVDKDGVYDPRLANDRLLLGMKGTMSELEHPEPTPPRPDAVKGRSGGAGATRAPLRAAGWGGTNTQLQQPVWQHSTGVKVRRMLMA